MSFNDTRPVVCYIEDNPADARLMAEALAQAERKSRLHVFPTPSEATKVLIEDKSMTPDLILLDGGLIDPDSLELLHRVRAAPDLCNVPVVMFTGFRETRTDCEKLWDQWVQKPMNWQSYSDTVTDILKLLPVV